MTTFMSLLLFLFWHLVNVDSAKRYSPRAALVNLIIICRNIFEFEKLGERKITYVHSCSHSAGKLLIRYMLL